MMDDRMLERRVRELATETTALPAPADAWERIAARVQAGETVLLPVHDTAPAQRRSLQRAVRAAMLVLLLGAAAAAALPGSPVREWLIDIVTRDGASPPQPAPPSEAATATETILLVEPVDGAIAVVLEAPAVGVRIHVRFADVKDLEVRARGATAAAQFRSAAGRLTIANAAAGELVLTIPRAVARVRVEVDGRAYLTKEHGRVSILAPAADTAGSEIILPITR